MKRELFVRSYLEFRRFAKETYQPVWSSEVMGSNVLFLVVGRHKALLLVGTTPHGNHLLHWSPGCPGDLAHGLVQWIGLDGHSTRDEGNPVSASHWMDVVVAGGKVVRLDSLMWDTKKLQEIMEWVKYRMKLLIFYDIFCLFSVKFFGKWSSVTQMLMPSTKPFFVLNPL